MTHSTTVYDPFFTTVCNSRFSTIHDQLCTTVRDRHFTIIPWPTFNNHPWPTLYSSKVKKSAFACVLSGLPFWLRVHRGAPFHSPSWEEHHIHQGAGEGVLQWLTKGPSPFLPLHWFPWSASLWTHPPPVWLVWCYLTNWCHFFMCLSPYWWWFSS